MKLVKQSVKVEIPGRKTLLRRLERYGRVCYKSEHKTTTDSYVEFIKRLINRGHISVLEHGYITAHFITDRGISHEFVRHRLISVTQESTRYCKYDKHVTFVIPYWATNIYNNPKNTAAFSKAEQIWYNSMLRAEADYQALLKKGCSPQEARDVLPLSTKTEFYVTANLREWQHIVNLRVSHEAHPQFSQLMLMWLEQVRKQLPIIFDYIPCKTPDTSGTL